MTEQQDQPIDAEIENELDGVPDHLTDGGGDEADSMASDLNKLAAELETARQDILYAQAEVQNVRRRMEKEAVDARSYAATNFARDILSVSDNLTRALEAIPAEMREDEKLKPVVTGLEATGRELDSVFAKHGITRIRRW
jgi:molecular chaperone GrpE